MQQKVLGKEPVEQRELQSERNETTHSRKFAILLGKLNTREST